ncbi:right-handed parallel beta-helix repeat-containing protein [Flammeovirga sp. SR4]|uniref:Right-handed parallel beta-helix repeat-containing protein n=2 Tax=Flammeovirga agarivorans TaxID=2726742 RepID=A0A7X8SKE0_9BACT|nr:right-handed parallel beta-helix repeat-containing protein [Flammeovirga agarivorans]
MNEMKITTNFFIIFFVHSLFFGSQLYATDYYIDAQNGNDTYNGTSEKTPWKSLQKVNTITLSAGDHVYLKSGQEHKGQLKPKGSGTEALPIVITKYGGDILPVINGQGYRANIYLNNVAGYEILDLEFINDGGDALDDHEKTDINRAAIYITSTLKIEKYFLLKGLKIHDIYPKGPTVDEDGDPTYNGQALTISTSSKNPTYIEKLIMEDCDIYDIGYRAITTGRWSRENTEAAYLYHKDFVLRNNNIYDIGGAGIVPIHIDGLLVEGNTTNFTGSTKDPRMIGRGSGIWPLYCKNVVIQHNNFMRARGKKDSCGAHVDIGNENTLIQYNYSYDNEGGFVEILGKNINTIYRYNVSVNDGWRVKNDRSPQYGVIFWMSGYAGNGEPNEGSINTQIYNNTIYVGEDITTRILMDYGMDTHFKNNIVINDGELIYYEKRDIGTHFDYNYFYGNDIKLQQSNKPMPYGSNDVVGVDPQVLNAGSLLDRDYRIKSTSPTIGTGAVIDENGGLDYWGQDLPNGKPTIGAYEYNVTSSGDLPTQFYVDAERGDDTNSGNDLKAAYKSLEMINKLSLVPGDKVYLKGVFEGAQLNIGNSGSEENPIIIAGISEEETPTLVMNASTSAIILTNADYVTLRNLKIEKGEGNNLQPSIKGVFNNALDHHDLSFENIHIFNTAGHGFSFVPDNGNLSNLSFKNVSVSNSKGSGLVAKDVSNITIESSEFLDNEGYAYFFEGENSMDIYRNRTVNNALGVLSASEDGQNIVARFNISINDGQFDADGKLWNIGSSSTFKGFNNTTYIPINRNLNVVVGDQSSVELRNNLFYHDGKVTFDLPSAYTADYNAFFGISEKPSFTFGEHTVFEDPLVMDKTSVEAEGFILSRTSPLNEAGEMIENIGPVDYFGDDIENISAWNIGFNMVASNEIVGDRVDPEKIYIDPVNGDDENDGFSPEQALKSLEQLSNTRIIAGDEILLSTESVHQGQLQIIGYGTLDKPIKVTNWGEGLATVKASGTNTVLLIEDQSNIEFENLSLTGAIYGVNIQQNDFPISGVSLKNIELKGLSTGVVVNGKSSKVKNVEIEGCTFDGLSSTAVILRNTEDFSLTANSFIDIQGNGIVLEEDNHGATITANSLIHVTASGIKTEGKLYQSEVSYNLFVDNLGELLIDAAEGTENAFLHNTYYTSQGKKQSIQFTENSEWDVINNIFQFDGSVEVVIAEKINFVNNNIYGVGIEFSGYPIDDKNTYDNPYLLDAGSSDKEEYMVFANSSMIGAATPIVTRATLDVLGNEISKVGSDLMGCIQVYSEDEVTSISEDIKHSKWIVYPNPSIGKVQVNLEEGAVVEVIAFNGNKFIRKVVNGSIDLEDLPRGAYILCYQHNRTKLILR